MTGNDKYIANRNGEFGRRDEMVNDREHRASLARLRQSNSKYGVQSPVQESLEDGFAKLNLIVKQLFEV